MAGSLIKIDEEIVTSAVSSVTLTGIDSTFDVYKVVLNNVKGDTDSVSFKERFTVSGTAQSTSNYDYAAKTIRDTGSFSNNSATNGTELFVNTQTAMGTGTGETLQGVRYLFNFNNASEYSFATFQEVSLLYDGELRGRQGGGVLTVSQATNGVNYFYSSGNVASGEFKLYGIVK